MDFHGGFYGHSETHEQIISSLKEIQLCSTVRCTVLQLTRTDSLNSLYEAFQDEITSGTVNKPTR